jgi:hypothetical protein
VDELAVAERNADVRSAAAHGREEHEVAGANLVAIDPLARVELLAHFTGERRPVLAEYPLHEAAAVESLRGFAPTVEVWRSAQRERRGDEGGRWRQEVSGLDLS